MIPKRSNEMCGNLAKVFQIGWAFRLRSLHSACHLPGSQWFCVLPGDFSIFTLTPLCPWTFIKCKEYLSSTFNVSKLFQM
jgi:hypothetical protein